MQRALSTFATAAIAVAAIQTPLAAQGAGEPHLHVNPRWHECSIQLDASLTQPAWRQFTQEAGLVAYFRPLADARPMGRGNFEVSMLQWKTGIDDHDAAWNDTFVHPDSAHWLFEGEGLAFPGLTARVGVTDRTDVGVYFTKNPGANYGFYGAQLQHSFLGGGGNRGTSAWATSARASLVSLYGPKDVAFSVYGADLLASRTVAITRWMSIAPYAGVSGYFAASHEKSAVVDLKDERVAGTQAMGGATLQLSKARLAVEYNIARVTTFSMRIGFGR